MELLFRTIFGTIKMEEPILVFMDKAEIIEFDEYSGKISRVHTKKREVVLRNEKRKQTVFTGIYFDDYEVGLELLKVVRELIKRASERRVKVIELEVNGDEMERLDEGKDEVKIGKLWELNPKLK